MWQPNKPGTEEEQAAANGVAGAQAEVAAAHASRKCHTLAPAQKAFGEAETKAHGAADEAAAAEAAQAAADEAAQAAANEAAEAIKKRSRENLRKRLVT